MIVMNEFSVSLHTPASPSFYFGLQQSSIAYLARANVA